MPRYIDMVHIVHRGCTTVIVQLLASMHVLNYVIKTLLS